MFLLPILISTCNSSSLAFLRMCSAYRLSKQNDNNMVSCLMFKSLSHFKFIFVHGVRMCSNLVDLNVAV